MKIVKEKNQYKVYLKEKFVFRREKEKFVFRREKGGEKSAKMEMHSIFPMDFQLLWDLTQDLC